MPLKLCVAAANEWPSAQDGGQELAAVSDRFLFRKTVRPIIGAVSRQRLLWTRDHTPTLSTRLTPAELDQAHREAVALPWTADAKEALETILRQLAQEGIQPGDRRQFNSMAAALAAEAFTAQFAPLREDTATKESDPELATLRAVGQAVASAATAVEECGEALRATGLGPGLPGSNDPQTIAAVYRRVRASPTLRQIMALAGRYRRLAQARQRQRSRHGQDDFVGLTLEGEVGRIVPAELALLALPERADDLLRRLVERQALCWERRGTEPVARGPILVVVDESGSMAGTKVHTAKALALALAWLARQQRRWCSLVAYSGNTGERLVPLPPGRWNEAALLDWLEAFLGGGSDRDVPLVELPNYYQRLGAPPGRTDLVCITDAQCRLPPTLQSAFHAWKAQVQARLITLVIDHDPGDLAAVSDEVHRVRTLDVSEAAVASVLS